MWGDGANLQRLAVVATAGAAATERRLYSMPAAPSTVAAGAVDSLGGDSPDILTTVSAGAYAANPALLVAYGLELHLVVGVTPCKLQLNVSVGPVVSAITALDGSLSFTAQSRQGSDDAMRVWQIPAAVVSAGLCSAAAVSVVRVQAFVPLSTLSVCGGGLAFVATTDSDNSTVRLWSIAPGGLVSSLPVGADGILGASGVWPRLACMWGRQVSGMVLSSQELAFMSVADGVVATASPAPQAPFATARSLIAVDTAEMVCFIADGVPAGGASALFCWTQAGGVLRAVGATLPAETNLAAQYGAQHGTHRAFMPCTRAGAAAGSLPRECAYDSILGKWLAAVEVGSLAPVYAPYSSGTMAGGTAYFAGQLQGASCAALWHLV